MQITAEQLEKTIANVLSGSLTKSLPEAVALAVDTKIKELGLDKIDAKHGFFPASFVGKTDEELKAMDKKQRVGLFIKSVFRKDLGQLATLGIKGMSEGTDADGGFLVPDEFSTEVIRIASDFGLVRKFARRIPMRTDTLNLNREDSAVTVYWPGEATAGTSSQPGIGRAKLKANTMVGLTPISNELLDDSSVDVVDYLMEIFAEAMAGEEDNQAFTGVGAPFTGILTDSNVTTVTMATGKDTFAEADADDLRDLISQINTTVLGNCAFIMHRSVWGSVQKIKENSQHIASLFHPIVMGAGIGQPGSASAGVGTGLVPAGYIWGYPVYLSDKMPSTTAVSTKFMIFGNLRYLALGDRQEMRLSVGAEATIGGVSMFETNQSAVRFTERIGLVIAKPTAFAVLKTAAS